MNEHQKKVDEFKRWFSNFPSKIRNKVVEYCEETGKDRIQLFDDSSKTNLFEMCIFCIVVGLVLYLDYLAVSYVSSLVGWPPDLYGFIILTAQILVLLYFVEETGIVIVFCMEMVLTGIMRSPFKSMCFFLIGFIIYFKW